MRGKPNGLIALSNYAGAAAERDASFRMLFQCGRIDGPRERCANRAREHPLDILSLSVPEFNAVGQLCAFCGRSRRRGQFLLVCAMGVSGTTSYLPSIKRKRGFKAEKL